MACENYKITTQLLKKKRLHLFPVNTYRNIATSPNQTTLRNILQGTQLISHTVYIGLLY